ncbi:uncharacterized protein LOC114357924 [Ostrinia furnacalis]|uniref:uncharacterized protein LOC114357924 n=1 Tax=Ostrinia furnacalis TaxID=93504 RepID=UPI00103DEB4F|nr:uncharacterized protein LOC114357924 [Ostrinia furnacalis]
MSPCNTYRSFAIYLLIVILIPESPVSAFTIRRARTTTLKSVDLDLAAEGSALLEVKSESSKLNNERKYIKYGTRKSSIRNSANVLGPDNKFASAGKRVAIQTTTAKLPNESDDVTKQSDHTTIRKNTETTTQYAIGKANTFKARAESIANASNKKNSSISVESTPQSLKIQTQVTNDDSDYYSTSTECSEADSSGTDDTHITTTGFTTTDNPTEETTTLVTKPQDDSISSDTTKEEIIIYQIIKKSTTPQTKFETDTTKLDEVEKDTTATDSTAHTEAMVGAFSNSPTNDPSWKKYTTIERKRIIPTPETEGVTTEAEELEKAESVSSRVTLENAVSGSPTTQGFNSNTKTTALETEGLKWSSTSQVFNNIPETGTESLPSTRPISSEIKNEQNLRGSLASRRAGYLDLSARQDTDEATTTEQYEDGKLNETELLGSMFEIDTQDNDGPELKNSTIVESQSQLADDAIKEELMKEAVLSDHEENSKRYSEEQQDINKVKPLENNADDSLSVKPISLGKNALYTSRSNYKPMKKIEVQPSKPYIRHPDDNSWRNESLSYLGIVFKAKNASKPFTQVLKNKTEAELNNWSEKENKNEVPDLRERLEKIAEVRKSKKKKLNQFGDMVYSDYEENSGETSSTPKQDAVPVPVMDIEGPLFFESFLTTPSVRKEVATRPTITPGVYMYKEETVTTTKKPKKMNKFAEYYDTTDEYDADYLSLSKIDLKKFTTHLFGKDKVTTPATMPTMFTKPMKTMLPDRRPTVQYFPPREKPRSEPQKVNINDYDSDFQKKVNMFAYSEPPKSSPVSPFTPPPASMEYKTTQRLKETSAIPGKMRQFKPGNLAKTVYDTSPPRVVDHNNRYPANNDETFNRASYVIRHFKDLIDEAVKDNYDKSAEFMQPYTEAPLVGVTAGRERDPTRVRLDDDYDYDPNFRKDILSRFVENFNQNSERFKVDFPILYNNSVVHMKADENGRVLASSTAFLKRQYGGAPAPMPGRPCCDMKVELSPAYELHYYVPEQEEKEEAEKPATMPFSYRL